MATRLLSILFQFCSVISSKRIKNIRIRIPSNEPRVRRIVFRARNISGRFEKRAPARIHFAYMDSDFLDIPVKQTSQSINKMKNQKSPEKISHFFKIYGRVHMAIKNLLAENITPAWPRLAFLTFFKHSMQKKGMAQLV